MDKTPIAYLITAVDALVWLQNLNQDFSAEKENTPDECYNLFRETIIKKDAALLTVKSAAFDLVRAFGQQAIIEEIVKHAEELHSLSPVDGQTLKQEYQLVFPDQQSATVDLAPNSQDYSLDKNYIAMHTISVRVAMEPYEPQLPKIQFYPGMIVRTPYKASANKDYPTLPIFFYIHSVEKENNAVVLVGWRLNEAIHAAQKYTTIRKVIADQYTYIVREDVSPKDIGLDSLVAIVGAK